MHGNIVRMPLLALALLATAGCGEEEPDAPPAMNGPATVVVEGTAPDVQLEASHGGTVVAAGPHPVEVVAQDDGVIEAYVVGDVPPAPGAQLTVTVQTDVGPRPVVLVWDDGRYYGVLEGPTIVRGPTEVVWVVDDRAYRGHVDTVVVVDVPRRRRPRGRVVVEHPVPRAQVVVEHPVPSAHVDVHLGVPAPPGVVVRGRGPRIRHQGPRIRHHGPRVRHHGPRLGGPVRHHRRHGHHGMRGRR